MTNDYKMPDWKRQTTIKYLTGAPHNNLNAFLLAIGSEVQSVHTRLKYKWSLETRARQQKQESFRFKSDESYYSSDKSGGAAPLGAKTAI